MKKYDLILTTVVDGFIWMEVGISNDVRSVVGTEVKREVIKNVPNVEIWGSETIIVFLR